MLSILANPTPNRPDNLKLLATDVYFTTKHCDDCGRSNASDQNGGFNYGQVIETVGSTVINGYLGIFQNVDFLKTASFGGSCQPSTYANRTAQCRFAVPLACKTGQTITGLLWEKFYDYLIGSGVTGTATITLKKMATDGTLTTIGTETHTVSAAAIKTIAINGTPTVMNAGDRLIIEVQIAPLSGTHNTSNFTFLQILPTAQYNIINIF